MHVVIINGSPRVEKYSNTDKIIDVFGEGLVQGGASFEKHAISARGAWQEARKAYLTNTEILFAMPLYVESAPGIFLEFLETLPKKDENTRVSFLLQGGFAEAGQMRCGEAFLETLPRYLGTSYGGCLVKGDNFSIRLCAEDERRKITGPYADMGLKFAEGNGFSFPEAKTFAGPERFGRMMQLLYSLIFKTLAPKRFAKAAEGWGCTRPIDDKPWEK